MRNIPDNKYLSELTIPGTHNSYARYSGSENMLPIVATFFEKYTICQDWTVEKQLEVGIRFFDVRFRPVENGFDVHHGPIWQKKNGEDVFREFKDFLKKNPSETVLISYQDETKGGKVNPGPGADDFKDILRGFLDNNDFKPWIYGKNNGESNTIMPTLGQARGKMVLIDKNGHGGWGLSNLNVEDKWKNPLTTVTWLPLKKELKYSKINGIKNNMRKAGKSKSKLYLSFCSASDAPLGYSNKKVADLINPKIKSFILEFSGNTKEAFGVVIFDFPTPDIIENLIKHNPVQKKVCATMEPESRDNFWTVTNGEMKSSLDGYWDDNIGYINLNRGCFFAAYHDMYYKGTKNFLLHKRDRSLISKDPEDYLIDNNGWIGHRWSNKISSFICRCQ